MSTCIYCEDNNTAEHFCCQICGKVESIELKKISSQKIVDRGKYIEKKKKKKNKKNNKKKTK